MSKADKKTEKKVKLSREEKKQLADLMQQARQQDSGPHSAQKTIPYQRMWPDGVCLTDDTHYTKTVQFQDINYQLAQNEDKTTIFEGWYDFLNYFDPSISVQFSFLNLAIGMESFEQSVFIPLKGDEFDAIREEYAAMLQNQLAKGNNGLTKTKYITFGVDADNYRTAKLRLERIELDILNNFKRLGAQAASLDGKERLALMHAMFHMDTQEPFRFDWKWLAPSGLSTKDFIAPSSFEFKETRTFRMGKKYAAVSNLPHGQKIRRRFLPANPGPGTGRPDAGRVPEHGKQPGGIHAHQKPGSDGGYQDY